MHVYRRSHHGKRHRQLSTRAKQAVRAQCSKGHQRLTRRISGQRRSLFDLFSTALAPDFEGTADIRNTTGSTLPVYKHYHSDIHMYCTSTVRRPPARRHASRRGLYLHSLLLALFALTFAPAPAGAQAQWSAEFTLLPDDGLQAILRRCGADGGECEVLAEGVVATGLSGSSYSLGSYAWQDGTVLTTEPLPAPPVAMNASSFREQYSESNIALGVEALASGAGVSAVGRGAYVVSIAPLNQPSQQLYAALNYAGTSWALICPVELLASPGRLVCWTESSMGAAFSAERKTVSLAATVTAEDETALLSILLQRMHQRAIARRGVEAVADGNAARTANSRGIVGGTWFLLMLIVLCLVLAVSTVLTWMAPLLPNQLLLISAWFYVLMALSMGLGWGAGFVGWMAVLAGAAVILLIGGIALAVSRARRRRKVAALGDEEVSPMTLQQVGDTSSSRSSGSNRVGKQKLSDGEDDAPYPLSPVAGRMPEPLSKLQRRLLWICLLLTGLVAVIIVVMVLGWNMSMYSVWDRTTHAPAEEFQPQMVGKALALAYSFDGLAARLRLNWLLGTYSVSCGAKYSAELTEAQKLADIKQDFIDKYSINMTMFSPSDYR